MSNLGFSGSYQPNDVSFLLRKLNIAHTNVEDKEKLIQSGKKHYSEMISLENPPTENHWENFNYALEHFGSRMALETQLLGNALLDRLNPEKPIILVSLVRAGVPLGVLLKNHISKHRACFHYGISIVRDKGIDQAALNHIMLNHPNDLENIVFVDGWTGKGAISRELTSSLKGMPVFFEHGMSIPKLVTLSDLAGGAWLASSRDDWLIPSGILGSVVSGLISRSIIDEHAKNGDLHGCVEYSHLQEHDISQKFIEDLTNQMNQQPTSDKCVWSDADRAIQKVKSDDVVAFIQSEYQIDNINRIKPSIAEATRAVLRRVPDRILLREPDDKNTLLLRHLAQKNNVPVDVVGNLLGNYHAVTVIKSV
ncbi:cysteine protease StiP family protein [Acinetobacter sp. P1(2025)]|uniref:cysteine protease StiP family protein n=1 Tax=Acinetobacter sp. P1(2025) TaxID=3446120 RepID=UPI003F52AEF0